MRLIDLRGINAWATCGGSRGKIFVVTNFFQVKVKLLRNGSVGFIFRGQFQYQASGESCGVFPVQFDDRH